MTQKSELEFKPAARSHQIGAPEVLDEENMTLRFSLSSEYPVRRFDYTRDEHFMEILSHRAEDVDLSRFATGAAFRDGHCGDQVGVISDPEVRDQKLFITVRFSKDNERAKLIYNDMKNGIRRNVSVCPEYTAPGQLEADKIENLRAIRFPWCPVHGATVADPADPTVGVGRSRPESENVLLKYVDNNTQIEKDETMSETISTENVEVFTAPERSQITGNDNSDLDRAITNERKRVREINAIAEQLKMQEAGMRAIEDGMPLDDFRKTVVNSLAARQNITMTKPVTEIGMSKKDMSQYSLTRALRQVAEGKALDGMEKECSDEMARQLKRAPQGFYIPSDIVNMRGNVVGTDAKGGYLVDTELRLNSMIEELYNAMVLPQLGVKMLHGLTGDVAIPTDDGGVNSYWLQENGEPSVSEFKVGQISMKPHTVGSFINLSRRLLIQSGSWVEAFVRYKIMRGIALEIQRAALLGTGKSNEPIGLLTALKDEQLIKIGTNGGAPLLKHLIALETKVADANADFGTMAYLTNSVIFGKLKQTPEFEEAFTRPILKTGSDGTGEINGYKAYRTNQIPKDLVKGSSKDCSAILFGNFSAMTLGFWSGLDITVDRATKAASGAVNVIALQDCDVKVTRQESFAAIKDARVVV